MKGYSIFLVARRIQYYERTNMHRYKNQHVHVLASNPVIIRFDMENIAIIMSSKRGARTSYDREELSSIAHREKKR